MIWGKTPTLPATILWTTPSSYIEKIWNINIIAIWVIPQRIKGRPHIFWHSGYPTMKLAANNIARLSSSLTALNLNWASYKGSFTTPLCDKAITQTHICPFMIALAAGFGVVSIKSARASMALTAPIVDRIRENDLQNAFSRKSSGI